MPRWQMQHNRLLYLSRVQSSLLVIYQTTYYISQKLGVWILCPSCNCCWDYLHSICLPRIMYFYPISTIDMVWQPKCYSASCKSSVHARSRHIKIDLHFIWDKVLQWAISIQYTINRIGCRYLHKTPSNLIVHHFQNSFVGYSSTHELARGW